MKIEKAVVNYNQKQNPYEYRLTVFIGLEVDSGPNYQVLLTSVQDLYLYFNTYNYSESFEMAKFCLNLGYNVLAQRVNILTGRSSCCKFITVDNRFGINTSKFFSPQEFKDYSNLQSHIVESSHNKICSEIIQFSDLKEGKSNYIDDDFLIIIQRLVEFENTNNYKNCILAGKNYNLEALKERFNNSDIIIEILSESITYGALHEKLKQFFIEKCNFDCIEYDGGDFYISYSSYFLPVEFRGVTYVSTIEDLITVKETDVGYQDNCCVLYDKNKICTFYSKYESSIDDIEVSVRNDNLYYYVVINKFNVDGIIVNSESFTYSRNVADINYISNISAESKLVDFVIYNEDADFSGDYKLKGKLNIKYEDEYIDSFKDTDDISFNADVCIDSSLNLTVDKKLEYVRKLYESYPNSIILTNNSGEFKSRVISVRPRILWRNIDTVFEGYSYLLYAIRNGSNVSDSYLISIAEELERNDPNSFMVEKTEYEVDLSGVYTKITDSSSSNLPVKSVLAIFAMENYIISRSKISIEEFYNAVDDSVRFVNKFLSTNINIDVVNAYQVGRKLIANLNFYTNNVIVTSYKLLVTILEG